MAFTKLEPNSVNTSATFSFNTVKTDNLQYANGTPWTGGGGGGTASTAGSNTQVQFNDAGVLGASANFTFDKSTNTLSVTNLAGNGASLHHITGANVTGAVSFATTANSVAGANVSGEVSYAAVANSVAAANITGTIVSTTAVTVTASAQPNITSVGTLANLTVAGPIDLGPLSNVKITGGTANYAITTDGLGNLTWANVAGGGGAAVAKFSKTYYWKGQLKENAGALRYYLPIASTVTTINAYLTSAGSTTSTITVKKNGTAINTFTFAAGVTSNLQSGLNYTMTTSDYLTVDITTSSSATDLYINFVYQG